MLQTHSNPMTANIKPNPNDQFFDIPNSQNKTQSLIDTLGVSLKSSLQTVWNYLKTIDVKLPRSQIKTQLSETKQLNDGKNIGQQSMLHNLQFNKNASPSLPLLKTSKPQKRSFLPQLPSNDQTLSKKQRLHSKKQQKKVISFDEFMTQQQRKLNESYIRKNIEQKKTLNKSILSQQQNNLNSSVVIESKQNLLNTSQQNLGKSAIKSTQKLLVPNNLILNPNNQTILNISDIDSECNFNILNNSDIYDLSDKNLRAGDNDQDEDDDQLIIKQKNHQKKNEPKLQLSEYPFMMRGKKIQLPKPNNNKKLTFSSTNSKTPFNKVSSKSIPENQVDFIDVDNITETYNKKIDQAIKRRLSASELANQIRKKVKPSYQNQYDDDESYDSEVTSRDQQFDQVLQRRYDFMIDDMLKNGTKNQLNNKEQISSLKDDFAKYVSKNFGAMQYIKTRILNNAKQTQKPPQKHTSTGQSQQRKQKLSQILKPLELSPEIQRKKLYNFTRQCESKINISFELQKSVKEDRQRQAAEERRKQKEEQDKRRKQEQDRMRREMQEKRRLEELERKRIQQQQEALRLAEQLKKQQQQKEEQQRNKEPKENGQELKSSQAKSVKQDGKSDEIASQELKESGSKQTQKPSPFAVAVASLFNKPKPQESSSTTLKDDNVSKEAQSGLLKKTSSVVDHKSTQPQKQPQSGSKQPQIPSAPQKKQSQKDQKDKKTTKYNPFMAAVAPAKPKISLLQEIVNSKKDQNSLFKTIITPTPATITSPQRKPNPPNPNSFMSPVQNKHNTSHYSNHDQSMCDQSESNITPASHLPNQANNLNGSFLNNSFSSQQQNSGLFGNPTSNPLFSSNTGASLFGSAYNPMNSGGMFGAPQQKSPTTGSLFTNTQINMFGSSMAPSNMAATQAVSKVPSFMQNHPTIAPGIDPQNAVNLFNQRSPTKNENTSLFAQVPSVPDKRTVSRRDKKNRQERIR